jgi:hypothetical protein
MVAELAPIALDEAVSGVGERGRFDVVDNRFGECRRRREVGCAGPPA